MKVFYDSNVILDVLLNRTEFVADSSAALKLSEINKVKCRCIITRNKKDFIQSDIPVFTPTEFIAQY
jgi:hypothetical protein